MCSSGLKTLRSSIVVPTNVNNMQMGEDDERPNGHASQTDEPDIDADTMALGLWKTVGLWLCPFCAQSFALPQASPAILLGVQPSTMS